MSGRFFESARRDFVSECVSRSVAFIIWLPFFLQSVSHTQHALFGFVRGQPCLVQCSLVWVVSWIRLLSARLGRQHTVRAAIRAAKTRWHVGCAVNKASLHTLRYPAVHQSLQRPSHHHGLSQVRFCRNPSSHAAKSILPQLCPARY